MACQGKQILADDRHFMKRKELEGMRPEDLNKLLRSESESVEWKRSLGEWKEIVVASAALASLHGGQICIGVEPTGKVCGVEAGKGTLEDLANKIAQSTSPRLIPSISAIERDRKTIVVVSVPESTPKPVCAFDRPYRRSGKTNQRLSQEEAMRLFMSSRGVTWDQSTVTDASVDEDIAPALVRRFLLAARSERRWEVPDETSMDRVLRQLGLIQDGKLTVAAVLLFDRNPQRLLTQAMVRCARFKGNTEVGITGMSCGTVGMSRKVSHKIQWEIAPEALSHAFPEIWFPWRYAACAPQVFCNCTAT